MGKYTPVSAADKYAEVGEDRPRCECHGEPRRWRSRADLRNGGNWSLCPIKDAAIIRTWEKKKLEGGLCLRCGKNQLHSPSYCLSCAKKRSASDRGRALERVGQGICVSCGKEPSYTKHRCYVCSLKSGEVNLRRRMLA